MSKPIFKLVDSLPENNLTVKMLKALDFVAPGQWKNLVGFEHTIKVVSGETDQAMIQKIGERAIALYNDKKQGYQRAVWLYQTVESMSNVLGFTALMNKVGEKIHLLRFLNHITPKADKAQGDRLLGQARHRAAGVHRPSTGSPATASATSSRA